MRNEYSKAGGVLENPHKGTGVNWQAVFAPAPLVQHQSEQLQNSKILNERHWCTDWLAQYFCINCTAMQNIVAFRGAIENQKQKQKQKQEQTQGLKEEGGAHLVSNMIRF